MTQFKVNKPNILLLAGGVGGAKLAEGLAAMEGISLSIIGNIADDEIFHGLWVSPDIDTLTYSLSGLVNRDQGWGLADEGSKALEMLKILGNDTWMFLGDKDFGLHIHRSNRLRQGYSRSEIASEIAQSLGVKVPLILPTDDVVQTRLKTNEGWILFQDYFVRQRCAPDVLDIRFEGAEQAKPTSQALTAIEQADLIIIAPSNPILSIEPILSIPGLKDALQSSKASILAVSPLIAGKPFKGPADKVMASLGLEASAIGVANHYRDLIDQIVIDDQDCEATAEIEDMGIACGLDDISMRDQADKVRLARSILANHVSFNGFVSSEAAQ
ncbi:2-phospho-L-lactate transferase [Cohaesibacter gelatinilyticus]|uniref:LPPG:FO 2-phospho-L-lactate transferase n=1 Tax=Cohaesibacter gelatinilyticus TaxID=372072 RepID=A0A285PEX9_9HYPH|nr:2-phospho-L-lactate transferase [Cohaesibacter gelatinilyticus]SNZ20280.1 LPPG:FO 2-phospho-L-lactate transferase [Cohaesibacter gelatinilyticus]